MVIDIDRLQSDEAYKAELRHRCETDHFFLGDLIGWNDFVPEYHEEARALYFPKNRNMPIAEQHPIKNRMHLDPRHTYKTTLGKIDSLQWVLAFPSLITMVNASSTQPLAAAISAQIANFFWVPTWQKDATNLQRLYPELCFGGASEAEGKWNTPNHSKLEMDATLDYTSPKTVQAGWHPWVLNPDDMVETTNSGIDADAKMRQKVINSYYTNKNTVRLGGYINIRGTIYHPQDLYNDILSKLDPDDWKTVIRGSLRMKDGRRLQPGEFPAEDEMILLFPKLLSYKTLRTKFHENYESFMCQQMNDSLGGSVPTFEENLYRSILVDPDNISILGETVICWRMAYAGKSYMKKASGAAARIYPGKVVIVDAWEGEYTPSGMIEKIVRECREHETGNVLMEEIPGSEAMEHNLRNESFRKNHPLRIEWIPYEEDDNMRNARMRQLEPVMRAGRLGISTAISKAQECRNQFQQFLLIPENGLVDVISRLSAKIPASVMREEVEEEEIELARRRREDLAYQMAFGQQGIEYQEGLQEAERKDKIRREASNYAWEKANNLGLPTLPGGLDG